MSLLSRKGLLAIAAVVDVALIAHARPLSARALAARHNLSPRHLEPVLQALVHERILRGIRGPRGGYELARDRRHISLEDILRAAGSVDEATQDAVAASQILSDIVMPTVQEAEQAFSARLAQITVEDLTHRAADRDARGGP